MSTNHPARAAGSAARSPTGAEVAAARIAAGLSYAECAALVYESPRRWAAFEQNDARMHPAAWELFKLKANATLRAIYDRLAAGDFYDDYDRASEMVGQLRRLMGHV